MVFSVLFLSISQCCVLEQITQRGATLLMLCSCAALGPTQPNLTYQLLQVADRRVRDVGLHAGHRAIPPHQAQLAPPVVSCQGEALLLLLKPTAGRQFVK